MSISMFSEITDLLMIGTDRDTFPSS